MVSHCPCVLNVPNALSLSRIAITHLHVLLMYLGAIDPRLSALVPLLGTLTDAEGTVARATGQETRVGGVLDVVADRTQEMVYWIYFAWAGAISVWIPLIFVTRGVIVDALVGYARTKGYTRLSFTGEGIYWWLVSSPYARSLSAVTKVLSFSLLAYGSPWGAWLAWAALAVNLMKGLPVIHKGLQLVSG